MGKSTVSKHLSLLGFSVFDADAEVHRLYSAGGAAVEPIKEIFPDVIVDNCVDRKLLSQKVLSLPTALKK
jgi:dephospho-CoA kinase